MKRWLIILLVVVVGLNIVLFWFYKQAGLKKQNQVTQPVAQSPATQYPYFPANTETFLDNEKTLQVRSFQPIFKEFVEVESANQGRSTMSYVTDNYLLVSYAPGGGGVLVEGKVFLGRQLPYIDEAGVKTTIDTLELKKKLKVGDQFGIDYLAKVPADFSMEIPYCKDFATRPVVCLLPFFKQESDKRGEIIFYPLTIYRILKR